MADADISLSLPLANESQSVPVSITGHTEETEPRDLLGGLGRDNKEQVERESGLVLVGRDMKIERSATRPDLITSS